MRRALALEGSFMKKDIHPKMVPAKVYCNGELVMETYSTKPEINVDVWSGNHPFFTGDRKSTRLNSSHVAISYAVFCLKKKSNRKATTTTTATPTAPHQTTL